MADLGRQDFLDAIESATTGTKEPTGYKAKARAGIPSKWFDLLMQNIEDRKSFFVDLHTFLYLLTGIVASILSLENGTQSRSQGRNQLRSLFHFLVRRGIYGDTIPSSYQDTAVLKYKEPVGICGINTSWNLPAAMITRKVAPALAEDVQLLLNHQVRLLLVL